MSNKVNEKMVSRIDAARRQIDAAIRLWLDGGDPLAVHTLAMASYGLLLDLMATKDEALHKEANRLVEETIGHAQFRQTANQLKHADKDPMRDVALPPDQNNESVVGRALVFHRVITDDVSELMGAFHLMMLMTHSEKFRVAADPDPDIEEGAQFGGRLLREDVKMRREFVQLLLRLIEQGTIPRNINLRRLSG